MMEDYKSNSHKSRAKNTDVDDKKIEKIVSGTVRTRKKSEFLKIMENFINDDIEDVKSYIFKDILIPAIKSSIIDAINIVLYGEVRGSSRKKSGETRISYRDYYPDDRRSNRAPSYAKRYEYDNIVLDNRGEAEDVLRSMDEILERYPTVSVADLNDLVGITGSYTDHHYGWTNLKNATITRVRDGYLLKLPKAMPFN